MSEDRTVGTVIIIIVVLLLSTITLGIYLDYRMHKERMAILKEAIQQGKDTIILEK